MAKVKQSSINTITRSQISRPDVHAKTKTSRLKKSKNYKKKYRGQGR
jgi:hypothetical protein